MDRNMGCKGCKGSGGGLLALGGGLPNGCQRPTANGRANTPCPRAPTLQRDAAATEHPPSGPWLEGPAVTARFSDSAARGAGRRPTQGMQSSEEARELRRTYGCADPTSPRWEGCRWGDTPRHGPHPTGLGCKGQNRESFQGSKRKLK